jgi:hypothetical protein
MTKTNVKKNKMCFRFVMFCGCDANAQVGVLNQGPCHSLSNQNVVQYIWFDHK